MPTEGMKPAAHQALVEAWQRRILHIIGQVIAHLHCATRLQEQSNVVIPRVTSQTCQASRCQTRPGGASGSHRALAKPARSALSYSRIHRCISALHCHDADPERASQGKAVCSASQVLMNQKSSLLQSIARALMSSHTRALASAAPTSFSSSELHNNTKCWGRPLMLSHCRASALQLDQKSVTGSPQTLGDPGKRPYHLLLSYEQGATKSSPVTGAHLQAEVQLWWRWARTGCSPIDGHTRCSAGNSGHCRASASSTKEPLWFQK